VSDDLDRLRADYADRERRLKDSELHTCLGSVCKIVQSCQSGSQRRPRRWKTSEIAAGDGGVSREKQGRMEFAYTL
jgi:hypothetical protein